MRPIPQWMGVRACDEVIDKLVVILRIGGLGRLHWFGNDKRPNRPAASTRFGGSAERVVALFMSLI